MDRVFSSVDEISDHLWSPPIHVAGVEDSSKMSRSASEWAFQRFLQEASASASATSPPSSSSAAADVVFVEIGDRPKPSIDGAPLPTNGAVLPDGPPPAPVDSEEYRAFLKSKLNLACAAVAMTRVIFAQYNVKRFHSFGFEIWICLALST